MAAFVPARFADEPFSTINTTPLVDVMLVLLIMFIVAIPAALNEIPLNLPNGRGTPETRVTHALTLARDGSVALDGAGLSGVALSARLKYIATVGDVVTVRADPQARYENFAQTLAVVKRAGITRLGFAHDEPAAL